MADKETGLNIPIGAYADEKSVKDATKKIYRELEGSLKDGRIEIPIELKAPIKGASNELVEAQKDVIKKLESASKKGFFSSSKESNDFLDSYVRFKKLVGQSHKNNQTQVKDLDAIIGKVAQLIKLEKNLKRVEQTTTTESVKTTRSTRTKRQPMTAEEKRRLKQEEKESVDYAINNQNGINKFVRKLAKSSTGNRTPMGDIRLGYRESTLGKSDLVTEESIKNSRSSPYQNYWGQMNKNLQRDNAELAKKIKSYKLNPEELFNKNKEIDAKITPKKKERAETQNRMALDSALLKSVKSTLNKIIGDNPKVTTDALSKIINANVARGREKGESPDITANKIANKILSVFYPNPKDDAIGSTDGTSKADAFNVEKINKLIKETLQRLGEEGEKALKEFTAEAEKLGVESSYTSKTKEKNSTLNKEVTRLNSKTEKAYVQSVRESTREGVADQAAGRASREANAISGDILETVEQDASTGFNTEKSSNALIKATSGGLSDIFSVLSDIRDILQNVMTGKIAGNGGSIGGQIYKKPKIHGLPTDVVINPETGLFYKTKAKGQRGRKPRAPQIPTVFSVINEREKYESAKLKRLQNSIEEERAQLEKGKHPSQQRQFLEPSEIFTTQKGIFGQIRKFIKDIIPQTEVDRIMSMNAKEQARMRAERIETYGLNRGRDLTDTGDIADVKRTKSLFGWIYKNDEKNKQLFQDIQLTPGFTGDKAIDTTAIMGALNKVLSGSEMFKAQTGGTLRNIIGSMTGYIGMDSIEKSRAQAEGLNQVMANVRNEVLQLIQDIQAKEATLIGMQERGTARFDKEGRITEDSSLAAKNTFTKLEEQKGVLKAALAEVGMIDQVVEKTGGKVSSIIKNLGFVMPELMKNNTIIQNINAGLDKNGKALKFQTRTAEILNYSFQLMSRHIGQIIKNWMWMVNPLNLIKQRFDDFASYDPKWQRTMNVIKNNFREIILPFMQKIAQTLVNIIGFFDIISMKIQEAFGYTPISLFDQKNANDFKKTYEEISNITAGFDELHDIGSSGGENDPDNLLGEIYKPQLSQGWIDLANEIGDLFAGIITGDLGFGEAMAKILGIAWKGIQQIWEWFKSTKLGQWLVNNWKGILGKILGIFLAWNLLKIAGSALFNALFGKLTAGAVTGVFSKIGGWITSALNMTSFGSGILQGLSNVLVNGGGLIKTLKYAFTYPGLITQMGGWGQMLGMAFIQSFGTVLGGLGVVKGFDIVADDASYNIGLMEAGGNEEDKKSGLGGKVLGTLSGAVAGGFAIGGPIGAAVGAVVGLLITSLAPAFEQVAVSAKEANNEMQKIEYYEGQVQGATTTVNEFSELLDMSNQALQSQTDKVYSLGENYGISKSRLDELVQAVKDGTYNTDMLTGSETNLSGALNQLSWQYTNNADLTDKLTQAKLKLQKAETDLAIAEDIAAGNFELAAARIEMAYASNVYTADEATKKMVQIAKEGSAEQATAMLKDLSPDLQAKFQKEYSTVEDNINELTDLYFSYSQDEREYFLQNLTGEVQKEMESRVNAIKQAVEKAPWWKRLLDIGNDGKIFGISYIDIPGYATGTNYVPSNGLAYLHQGEAVIPKKYNQPYQPNTMDQAYVDQIITTMRALDTTIQQGITVKGEFKQKGTDLVATVKKVENRNGNQPLNNPVFAR